MSLTKRCQQIVALVKRLRSCANAEDNARISIILKLHMYVTRLHKQSSCIANGLRGRSGDVMFPRRDCTFVSRFQCRLLSSRLKAQSGESISYDRQEVIGTDLSNKSLPVHGRARGWTRRGTNFLKFLRPASSGICIT